MQKFGNFLQTVVTPLVVLMTGGLILHDHLPTKGPAAPAPIVLREGAVTPAGPRASAGEDAPPPPTIGAWALGRAYAPVLADSLGDGWLAAAEALERGKTVPEAQADLQSAWRAARVRTFSAEVAPAFAAVLPEGSEPTDPAKRAEVVKLWRDFASGLKRGH